MTELAKRYGGSLYDLAAEEQLTDQLLAELDVALDCFNQEPAYLRLLSTPGVPKKERCALLDKAFAEAHPYLVNFLKLLCEENLLAELPIEEIHKHQTEYISLQVDDVAHAATLLEQMGIANFSVLDKEFIRIYDSNISGKVLSKALIESGVGLESLGRKQDTLEDYFFQLTEEGK